MMPRALPAVVIEQTERQLGELVAEHKPGSGAIK
jgi:hypothetical protein